MVFFFFVVFFFLWTEDTWLWYPLMEDSVLGILQAWRPLFLKTERINVAVKHTDTDKSVQGSNHSIFSEFLLQSFGPRLIGK